LKVDYNPRVDFPKRNRMVKFLGAVLLLAAGLIFTGGPGIPHPAHAQHPTLSIPTVTGTPSGPIAAVYFNLVQIPVLAGPGQNFPQVGLLVAGQKVPALGASPGGEWVMIAYPGVPSGIGWVYGSLVGVDKPLEMVTPPATPTPRVTPTLNPTLEAQMAGFVVTPTRLPTFTPAAPQPAPTFEAPGIGGLEPGAIPIGFIIIGLAVLGLFGTMLTFLRGR
jgi:hypothetical protein